MPTRGQSPSRLRFDSFEVDLRSGEVWKDGLRVRVQEQPFQVLRVLLEHRGDIVTRDELRQTLWPADTFVDFDDGLNTAVKKIRDLLGDSAERPRYIETIPRRGYRFMTPVEAAAAAGVARSSAAALRPAWLAFALIIVAALALFPWRNRQPRPEISAVRAIAVLPLQNLSGDASQDYFAAGLTDALTTELARTVGGSLRVISHTSAAKYKDKPLTEIARDLDVDAVIEGSVVRSGSRARISAKLIHARADKHLWAGSYDRDLSDILSLQREIAATVAGQVQVALSPRAQSRLMAAGRINPQAYDLYQRARDGAFSNNRQDLTAAIDLLEQAAKYEPNLPAAHALLARAYNNLAFLHAPQQEELEFKALEDVNRALTEDPDLAEAYLARGLIYWTHRNGFPHERAIVDIKRALELDPNLAEAHHWLGTIYLHIGLLDKAGGELETARVLDPANTGVRYRIAINQLVQGRLSEAVSGLEGTRRFFPDGWSYQMALALFKLGRKPEAVALVRDYLRDNPRDEGGLGNAVQALIYADTGNSSLAEESIQQAIEHGKDFGHFHHAAYAIGLAYAAINKPTEAVKWLRAAAEDGFPCYPFYEHDVTLQNLRRDPAFLQLMASMRSDWERRRATL